MYLYKKKNGKKFDLKIGRYRGLPYSGWTYQSETTLLSCLNIEILKGELRQFTPYTRLGPTGIRKSSQNACALMLILKAT